MFEGLNITGSVSFLLVFFEGIISFLSPCVLPLIPLYVSYLAGNSQHKNKDGEITYKGKKVLFNTMFFVLGISTAFFILGISFTALGAFFNNNKELFSKTAGILIIVLGFHQVGIFNFNFLQMEHKVKFNFSEKSMNPLIAYIMGFTFSFAWTPCVGPALSSVLMLASSAKNALTGNLLVLVYSLGFVIPFLILGLFTTQALNFIKNNRKIVKYTIKIGGVIMIIMGIMTFTGWLNDVTGYLSTGGNNINNSTSVNSEDDKTVKEEVLHTAFDFTLTDQYGNKHKLSDYKGKTVFLNFWATWCPPCKGEMPYIEELFKEFNFNKDDVVILGVATPGGREKSTEGIKEFLNEKGYAFPVVFDESGKVTEIYQIRSLPTTFMINTNGEIYGYVTGALNKEQMNSIIKQTQENKPKN
ncbi:cytochrome c biogenesis protein CcdA [Clostridium tarantellae]|uniref:Redoxin domain-containing protein n=1 Tax=Clostridium tarantellae TaxID=39493 RepID=A0A6I1MJ69_9CLOT|nr:cytochrome c biogenesis protein CcdA [Clostridium tarantellae]MPQ43150.1 redoxin domain-containing protein [Clostridium tarantellae]